MPDDVGQRLLSTKLAVGDVEEMGVALDRAERVPGFHVGLIIVAIARIDVVMNRNGAVVGHAQGIDPLLEIRTVVFAVALWQFQARMGRAGDAPKCFDGGTVVVNAFGTDVKSLNGRDDQAGQ